MCGYLPAGRGLATRAIDAHDGTGPGTWSYSVVPPSIINSYPGPASFTRTVTDPQGNQTVVLLSQFGTRCQFYESRVQQYQSSATLLKTVTTDYSYESENDPQLATGYVMNVVPIRVTTSWAGGKTKKIEMTYDAGFTVNNLHGIYGNLIQKNEYDFGSGGSGPLLRTTNYSVVS